MSNVNDDEDIVMADNILDLELDTLLLNQSTRSTSISRVPNKKTYDFQTSNGQWSEELYCKGQIRSNNNSTLLDSTHTPSSPGMPSLETAWDVESTTPATSNRTLPPALEEQTAWIMPERKRP